MYVCIYIFVFYLFDRGSELMEHRHHNLISAARSTIPSVTGLVLQKQMPKWRLRCKAQGITQAKESERKQDWAKREIKLWCSLCLELWKQRCQSCPSLDWNVWLLIIFHMQYYVRALLEGHDPEQGVSVGKAVCWLLSLKMGRMSFFFF